MNIKTLLAYLCGNRQEILDVADSRPALWLGLIFVLSAGFAREYDGEYLLREPWHLAIPLVASLATSFLLFGLVRIVAKERGLGVPFRSGYRQFLTLYWMTAPLAWLYAIPIERFATAAQATQFNLSLLGIVAIWRVLLITRVVSVLYSAHFASAFFVVMFFADSVMLVILFFTPLPIFAVMGGIRLSESERMLQSAAFSVGFLGLISWFIWLIGTISVAHLWPRRWSLTVPTTSQNPYISRPLWALAAASLLVWFPIMTIPQPEQRLRWQTEQLFVTDSIDDALAFLSRYEPSDFPPHWDLPPRIGYGQGQPPILDVMDRLATDRYASWVRDVYVQKTILWLDGFASYEFWRATSPEKFDRYLTLLEQYPELIEEQKTRLKSQIGEDSNRTTEQQARIRKLLGEEFAPDAIKSENSSTTD